MKSKRKKNRDIQKIKSRLGVSRKKNYTKQRNVDINTPINDSIQSEIIAPTDTNIESQNTIINYPYLKREIFQIIGTFGFVLSILIGLTFII
tara:strand:+ start:180 stop:455 length:276 start_codon:yes stop_codon:yes gene_type:complete